MDIAGNSSAGSTDLCIASVAIGAGSSIRICADVAVSVSTNWSAESVALYKVVVGDAAGAC